MVTTAEDAERAAKALAAPSWSKRRSTPAGGARAPSRPRPTSTASRCAKPRKTRASTPAKILGKELVTHQTGPEGQTVRRVLVEQATDIGKSSTSAWCWTARPRE